MKKSLFILCCLFYTASLFAQDPSLSAIAFNPALPEENTSGNSSFLFSLISGADIPLAQELKVTISLTNVAFTGPPTGGGADLFDWVANGTTGYQGTQNTILSPFIIAPINFNYDVTGAIGATAFMVAQLSNTTGLSGNDPDNDLTNVQAEILLDPLPVELISFNGNVNNCESIDLTWRTGTEINNKGFEIERMNEDNRVFETLTFVEGLGSSVNGKVYELELPFDSGFSGKSQLFRLKQIDFDGSSSYSHVIAIGNHCFKNVEMELFPNPAIDVVHIMLRAGDSGEQEIVLINEFQQIERKININLNESNSIEIGDLSPGVYFVQAVYGNEFLVKRFVKVKN